MRKLVERIATATLGFMLAVMTTLVLLQLFQAPIPFSYIQFFYPTLLSSLYGVMFCGPFLVALIYLAGNEETWTSFASSESSICGFILAQVIWIYLVLSTALASYGIVPVIIACWFGFIVTSRSVRSAFQNRGGRSTDILAGLFLVLLLWVRVSVFLSPYYMPSSQAGVFLMSDAAIVTVIAYGFQKTRDRMMNTSAFIGGYVFILLIIGNLYLAVFAYGDPYWLENQMLRSILADAILPLAELVIFLLYTYPMIRPYVIGGKAPRALFAAYVLLIASYLPFFSQALILTALSPFGYMPVFLLALSVIGLIPLVDHIVNRFRPAASTEPEETSEVTPELSQRKITPFLSYLKDTARLWPALETSLFLVLASGIALSFFVMGGQPIRFYMYMNPVQLFAVIVVFAGPILLSFIAIASTSPTREELRNWRFISAMVLLAIADAFYALFILPPLLNSGVQGAIIQYLLMVGALVAYRGTRNTIFDLGGWTGEFYRNHRVSISATIFLFSLIIILSTGTIFYYLGTFTIFTVGISGLLALATARTTIGSVASSVRTIHSERSERLRGKRWTQLVDTVNASIKRIDNLFQDRPAFFYEELVDMADKEQAKAVKALTGLRGTADPSSSEELSIISDLESQLQKTYLQTIAEAESFVPAGTRPTSDLLLPADGKVEAVRGCEIVGGTFEFKPKVMNKSGSVITNVTVSIVAFPDDCLEIAGEKSKTIGRIEVGGFRSPQFLFTPTKDCVEGNIVASVSYLDYKDQVRTIDVRPYTIRSVCDLLTPLTIEEKQLDLVLDGMQSTSDEQTVEWNPQVLFAKTKRLLATKNFYGTDSEEHIAAGQYVGTIRGIAQGKYTGKRIAAIVSITGAAEGTRARVKIDVLGDDIAMLPTTIDELTDGIDSWICMSCGAPLEPEQVTLIKSSAGTQCGFCFSNLSKAQYSLGSDGN